MRVGQIPPVALTIAGSDSSGGAGIQADLKTFTALGVYGMSVITALTAQNTAGVTGVHAVPAEFVLAQLEAVMSDIGCAAAKTGMLANAEIVRAVARGVEQWQVPRLVVDPVMVAKSGAELLEREAVGALLDELIPRAYAVTPNVPEAEVLTGLKIRGTDEAAEAARRIGEMGPEVVIVKGGHLAGAADDVAWIRGAVEILPGPRIETTATHGTGCIFSAALAAELAKGREPLVAARRAKLFVTEAIRYGLPLGKGHGPANVLAAMAMVPAD